MSPEAPFRLGAHPLELARRSVKRTVAKRKTRKGDDVLVGRIYPTKTPEAITRTDEEHLIGDTLDSFRNGGQVCLKKL